MMWKEEKCTMVKFMENVIQLGGEFKKILPISTSYESEEDGKRSVPEEVEFATPEELADELISFTKKEFPDERNVWINNIAELFWKSKNIDVWNLTPKMQLKIEKAEMIAQRKFEKDRMMKEKELLEKEKGELNAIVASCVDWAKEHGLKRVTKADVEAFLLEKNIEILPQSQRAVYALVNVQLKSKR
ncbi:MAG: hypothetical protein ACTSRP_16570 [Candidatus Helarchaeota archaeon]